MLAASYAQSRKYCWNDMKELKYELVLYFAKLLLVICDELIGQGENLKDGSWKEIICFCKIACECALVNDGLVLLLKLWPAELHCRLQQCQHSKSASKSQKYTGISMMGKCDKDYIFED
jgi:hypothetical protein